MGAARFARAIKDEDGHGDTGGGEQVGGQAHHGVQQVFLNEPLADAPLRHPPAKQHPMGHDHGHTARVGAWRFPPCG